MTDTDVPTSTDEATDAPSDSNGFALPALDADSLLRTVKVGAAIAQAAIDAVEEFGLDTGSSLLRLGVLQLLDLQQQQVTPTDDDDKFLLEAYRAWIEVALRYFGPDADASARDYARTASILSAEMHLAPELPGIERTSTS